MPFLTEAIRQVRQALGLDALFHARTLTGALALKLTDGTLQLMDPGGASRTVTLPAVSNLDTGRVFAVYNTADADGELLTVNNPAASPLLVLNRGEIGFVRVAAGAWVAVGPKLGTQGAQGVIADPGDAGAIPVTGSGTCLLTTGASGETRTLAIPTFVGQRLVIAHDVDGGGAAVVTVASEMNETGNNTMSFDDPGEAIELIAVRVSGALAWRGAVIGGGPTLSTV